MSTFANSFWSADYAAGLGVLFDKLQQGVQENQQILTIARMRAEAEEQYGNKLGEITPTTDRIPGGFQKDDGASVRKAFDGVRNEMEAAASNHRKISSNIRELVVHPFGRWCEQHSARVQGAQDDLQQRIKSHDRQADTVRKLRSQYYNKCRLVEDLEEEDKLAFQDPQADAAQSPKGKGKEAAVPTIKEPEEEPEEPEPIELGDQLYHPEQIKKILTHMLETIKLGETKVPILGTYLNVSTGADITEYVQSHMGATNIAAAEKIGQDLVDNGFLRLIGNVGNAFANSTRMNYQWRPKVFQLTGITEKKNVQRVGTGTFAVDVADVGAVGEYLSNWNPLNNPHANETPAEKLRREARESDDRYKTAVRKLDALRCSLEEAMVDRLKWLERCELDRLKAIKAVVLDFSGAIGNVIPSLQSTVDRMMLFQETVQPVGDLRYLLENYRTGNFVPKVQIYENYYNNVDGQTFGVDLEARARADKKRVPLIVTTLLTYLDDHYPNLEGDEARRAIWLIDVPISATHHLRTTINDGKPITREILEQYEIPIIASVLKLYLLELPDPIVSSHVYEIIKAIYSNPATESQESTRIQVIQNTLGTLRLANIASLDAITTHFTRLIELTSADDAYISTLATNLAPCILRPKYETTLTMNERFAYRLLRDLFAHKEEIFGELKRASSLKMREAASTTTAAAPRGRGFSSTDERSRREMEQERQAAIISATDRSRATSPAPGSSRIRRERSPHRMSGSAETRFPVTPQGIQVGSPTERRATVSRNSLEVPGSATTLAASSAPEASAAQETNGTAATAAQPARPKGVELTDKPMDD